MQFLALLLKQELESRIKLADLQWEWKEVIRGLDALQRVEANFQGRGFLFRSHLTADAALKVVGQALDGEEACLLYDELCPDILILDLQMPKKDGQEVVAELMSRRPRLGGF